MSAMACILGICALRIRWLYVIISTDMRSEGGFDHGCIYTDARATGQETAPETTDLDRPDYKVNCAVDLAHTRLQTDLVEVLSQWARIQAEPWIVRTDEWYPCQEAGYVPRFFPDNVIRMDHVLCSLNQKGYDEEKYGRPPALLVEVLSWATPQRDRPGEYEVYEAHGVQEYWILDVRYQSAFMGDKSVQAWSLEAGCYVPLSLQTHGRKWWLESPLLGTQVAFGQVDEWNWRSNRWSLQIWNLQAKRWLISKERKLAQAKAALRAGGIDLDMVKNINTLT